MKVRLVFAEGRKINLGKGNPAIIPDTKAEIALWNRLARFINDNHRAVIDWISSEIQKINNPESNVISFRNPTQKYFNTADLIKQLDDQILQIELLPEGDKLIKKIRSYQAAIRKYKRADEANIQALKAELEEIFAEMETIYSKHAVVK